MNTIELKRTAPERPHRAGKLRRPFSVFAADVLCHLRVAELLARLRYEGREGEEVVNGATSCESLLTRLGRLRRRQLSRAPFSGHASED